MIDPEAIWLKMNFHRTRIWWLGALLTTLNVACHTYDAAPVPRYRITKAAQTAYNLAVTMTYQYDGQGRIASVKEYLSVADTLDRVTPVAQTTVNYDAKAPTHIDHTDRRLTKPQTDAEGPVYGTRRVFGYDKQGRLSSVIESRAIDDFKTFKLAQTFQYEYGSDNLPVSLTVAGGPLQERDVYTYTFLNGNAVHIQLTVTNSRLSAPLVTESDVRFDDAPSVYYHYFAIYPGITSFNKNNVINTNTTLYHDDRGLLTRRVKTGYYVDDVTLYTYEVY
ncbi:MAG: hypothetical protein JWP57_1869 [Spirosoma sp.]|nr:hypothetical protein [Spirosoma sp.]